MRKNKVKLGLSLLTVLATPIAVNAVVSHDVNAEYRESIFYNNNKPANWWYSDGEDWYFFQNGKKLTGYGKDNAGTHYFVNGKYANGKIGNKEYRDGKEISVENKVPTRAYANGVYYVDAKPANWWYDDGTNWYFFQNGKKLTGYGKDNAGIHYFVNGKYANWWYDDGTDWFFFQNGKKLTGYGKDNDGTHYFVNGKYANGLHNGKYYLNGQVSTNASALNMPQYYQWDKHWGNRRYGASNLTMAGCVPTSLAMVFSGLGQQVLPPAVADTISSGGGLNTNGVGTSAKGAAYAINKHGYNYRVLKTKEQLISALQNGEPVLATVKQGYFVRSAYATHAIVLSGYDNGKVKAMDPYNTNATGKWYSINEIWNQRSDADSDTMLGGSFTAIGK